MKLELDDYKIVTDERQYILQKKKITQETKFTKAENIGKITYGNEKYFSKLEPLLEFIGEDIVKQYDDLVEIKQKLNELQGKIMEFTYLLKLKA